jgi:hypothetical protein
MFWSRSISKFGCGSCSAGSAGSILAERPKNRAHLGIRKWPLREQGLPPGARSGGPVDDAVELLLAALLLLLGRLAILDVGVRAVARDDVAAIFGLTENLKELRPLCNVR